MWFLLFFTSVSWGILLTTNLADHAENSHMSLSSFFLPFFYISSFWNLEIYLYMFLLLFFVFFSAPYLVHPSSTFYSSFCSLFSSLPLFIHLIFWSPLMFSFLICHPFFLFMLLYSACFSLNFYYYPYCSLSVVLHLSTALYLALLCYLFCSCFCFLYILSFW